MKNEIFVITKDHLKLLKKMWVGWQDCEFGAPEIDPKRPYGNSSVTNDIHEILTGESIGCTHSKRDELTEEEEKYYFKMHKEMERVLQICLVTGKFQTGKFEKTNEYNSLSWKKIK